MFKGKKEEQNTRIIDILDTLCSFLGIKIPQQEMGNHGHSAEKMDIVQSNKKTKGKLLLGRLIG